MILNKLRQDLIGSKMTLKELDDYMLTALSSIEMEMSLESAFKGNVLEYIHSGGCRWGDYKVDWDYELRFADDDMREAILTVKNIELLVWVFEIIE